MGRTNYSYEKRKKELEKKKKKEEKLKKKQLKKQNPDGLDNREYPDGEENDEQAQDPPEAN